MKRSKANNLSTDKNNLEQTFDASFATRLALREKQIQQNYRPIIGIHKWFARRPGTMFRSLILSEFCGSKPLSESFWEAHNFKGVIADPFMGGGTPIYEANRLGFHVIGTDINPMAFWVVRQSLEKLDLALFAEEAERVAQDVESEIGSLYKTQCLKCDEKADVKYFLWVKTADCPKCKSSNDLFPGFLLAEDERHPKNVVVCSCCGELNEFETVPKSEKPAKCKSCKKLISVEGSAKRQQISCNSCGHEYSYLPKNIKRPLEHRMFAIEYNCGSCKKTHKGRFFKKPEIDDLALFAKAKKLLNKVKPPLPENDIPAGDESDRLHRWGYFRYKDMFNDRQLLGLGILLQRINTVQSDEIRHALLTVFSDILRYQNLLCRYDTYALKCQDIFSVHGFPVGLVQCENNVLGIPRVGSGAFRHFVEKYLTAKEYCQKPFETTNDGPKKRTIQIDEKIEAELVNQYPSGIKKQARILAAPAWEMPLKDNLLDGVFTDPPYFDNVQYAELMDFCFSWLRLGLDREFKEFRPESTRAADELTGNVTMGRGLEHFTGGLSRVFSHYASALKPNRPFVFTYHHNDPEAYLPLVVAILDSGLFCSDTLPAAAEMSASLHISGTGSSILDSVFVCRKYVSKKSIRDQFQLGWIELLKEDLERDIASMTKAGVKVSDGDRNCLLAGHIARFAINQLVNEWDQSKSLEQRMTLARKTLIEITNMIGIKHKKKNKGSKDMQQVLDKERAASV